MAYLSRWASPDLDDSAPATEVIRLAVLATSRLEREIVAAALAGEPCVEVIEVGSPWDLAPGVVARVGADIVLATVDDSMLGELAGIAAARPGVRLVVIADATDTLLMDQVLAAPVSGVVDPSSGLRSLIDTLRLVHQGQTAIPRSVLSALLNRSLGRPADISEERSGSGRLTPREQDVLTLMALGYGTRRIAERLFLSVNTVRSHIQGVMAKLDAHTRLEAVARARSLGLVRMDSRPD